MVLVVVVVCCLSIASLFLCSVSAVFFCFITACSAQFHESVCHPVVSTFKIGACDLLNVFLQNIISMVLINQGRDGAEN